MSFTNRKAQIQLLLFLAVAPLVAQSRSGELRLLVKDPSGQPLAAAAILSNEAHQYRREFKTDADGKTTAQLLPFGLYRLEVRREGFALYAATLAIRSELPVNYTATLGVATLETTLTVTAPASLLDPYKSSPGATVGEQTLSERAGSQPGRDLLDVVQSQPGWLLEANGVLHPRGAEYDTQYVVDGLPVLDNRSPVFAPSLEADELASVTVLTAGYPAEYGRKLGGVVELSSARPSGPGFHGKASLQGGSYASSSGFLWGQYSGKRSTVSLSANGALTDRYLDPPVEQNYSNHASLYGVSASWEQDITDRDRLRLSVQNRHTGFLVPNEQLQEAAGQRQDRTNGETMGQFSYQRILSPHYMLNIRGLLRDLSADLWSNPLATPIEAFQQRGFREGYVQASLSGHNGRHDWKAGGEGDFASLREQFAYHLTSYSLNDQQIFDPDTPPDFQFQGRKQDREQSAYVQDQIRFGPLTVSAGLRFDHYRLLVEQSAVSPRLGAAWYVPAKGLVLRASYDRLFQTPATENLLLSSSEAVRSLNPGAVFLPVKPSLGHQVELGFSKSLWGKMRLSGTWYRRSLSNLGDDDLLLNTGVSFPIAFRSANIHGIEAELELPHWGPVTASVNYTNMIGRARLPVVGGLFLDAGAADLLNSTAQLPISQDQRNTARGRFRYQLSKRLWTAWSGSYGSGLPTELDSPDLNALEQQYGARILSRVNFDRGRVRPNFSLDASLGAEVWQRERRSVRVQADVQNLTDRLNVINFAGLFSGTAIGVGRTASVRLQIGF